MASGSCLTPCRHTPLARRRGRLALGHPAPCTSVAPSCIKNCRQSVSPHQSSRCRPVHDPLTDVEARVLGSLIEKETTTPENYPLSLNALMNACNQSSNRDPVAQYDEKTVGAAVESLRKRALIRAVQQSGSRVMKYRHLVRESMNLDD